MKSLPFLCLCLLPLLAIAEEGPSALQSLDPGGDLSGPGCLASCEATLAACKQQCLDMSARAAEEHFDEPDVSVSVCIDGCEKDASFCKEDC